MPSARVKQPGAKTRIARFFLPDVREDSALLPSDRWIMDTAMDIIKSHNELKKNLRRIAAFAVLAVATAGAGIAGAFLAVPAVAAGIGIGALAGVAALGKKIHDGWNNIKINILPELRSEIARRYITMKGRQFVDEWKNRIEQSRKKQLDGQPLKDALKKAQSPETPQKNQRQHPINPPQT